MPEAQENVRSSLHSSCCYFWIYPCGAGGKGIRASILNVSEIPEFAKSKACVVNDEREGRKGNFVSSACNT